MRLRMLQAATLIGLFATGALAAPKAASPAAAGKWPFKTLRYQQRVTVGQGKESRQQFMKGYAKGGKARLETATYVVISDGKQTWVYLPKTKQAIALPRGAVSMLDGSKQTLERTLQGGRKTGKDKIGAYLCDVYTASPKNGKGQTIRVKAWVYPKWNLPLRAETAAPGAPLIVVETLNIKTDLPLDDGLFTLPKGTTIVKGKQGMVPLGRQ